LLFIIKIRFFYEKLENNLNLILLLLLILKVIIKK